MDHAVEGDRGGSDMTTLMLRSVVEGSTRFLVTSSFVWVFSWATCLQVQAEEPETLLIGPPPGATSTYTLSSGLLETGGTVVGPQGRFEHSGGAHLVAGELQLRGGNVLSGGGTAYAFYTLEEGDVAAVTLHVSIGVFSQLGGSSIATEVILGPHNAQCTFQLTGGELESQRTFVYGSWLGGFKQSGGKHRIAEQLTISGDEFQQALYSLSNGELECRDIEIRHGRFQHDSGKLLHAGEVVIENGVWETRADSASLGVLRVMGSGDSTAAIRLAGDSGVLRFADSSAAVWDSEASLVIEAWDGSIRGGGREQVLFGSATNGLTAQQLSRVMFKNPAGVAPGFYPARLLPTGEVVPGPFIENLVEGGTLRLKWEAGYILQSSTSVCGPFEDVASAVSPYAYDGREGIRYFRLRR